MRSVALKVVIAGSWGIIAALTFTNHGMKQQYDKLEEEIRIKTIEINKLPTAYDKITNQKQTTSIINEPSYLHPAAFRNIGCGNCPYTNPTFPCIGPDQAFICPKTRPYFIASSWYLMRDSVPYATDLKDKQALDSFFENIEMVRNIINDYCKENYKHNDIHITLKTDAGYHLTYQYLNCQTKQNIEKLVRNEMEIFGDDKNYIDIFTEYGFTSWNDIVIGFDKTLCMVDHSSPTVTFDLFLDDKSQELFKKLIERTEYIEQSKYGVKPYLSRNLHQQAFHFTIGSIYIEENDYNEFDSKGLMNRINEEMHGKFAAIKLLNFPHFAATMMTNTYTLDKQYKFKKDKLAVFD